MNCLLNIPRFSVSPLPNADSRLRRSFRSAQNSLPLVNLADRHRIITMEVTSGSVSNAEIIGDRHRRMAIKAASGSASSAEIGDTDTEVEEKSEVYSNNMSEAMGSALVYRHENGINYNFITSDIIVGSCLQTPDDVDKLREIGVKTIFCLQQNPDLEYFGVDIKAIQEYAKTFDDIEHVRSEIRDFDAHDLRLQLPDVIKILNAAINRNGGVTYIHCTAGLGRAPSVAVAYMYWVQGYKIDEAVNLLLSKRSCSPKVDVIKTATIDILTGLKKLPAKFSWKSGNCSTVEISGLDIGWGQRTPLNFDNNSGSWKLEKELYEGHYEYKYIVDGNWTFNEHELVAAPTRDGHVNNVIEVGDKDSNGARQLLRERISDNGGDLTTEERAMIKEFIVEE